MKFGLNTPGVAVALTAPLSVPKNASVPKSMANDPVTGPTAPALHTECA